MSTQYVTDEIKALIGASVGPTATYHVVEESEVRRFSQATMDSAPRYFDREYATSSRYGGLVAPAAYAVNAFRRTPQEPDPLDDMGKPDFDGSAARSFRGLPPINVPLPRLLNGGYTYEFFRYVKIGERIYRTSRYKDIYQREGKSGPMVFVLVEDSFTVDGGEPLLNVVTTSILR